MIFGTNEGPTHKFMSEIGPAAEMPFAFGARIVFFFSPILLFIAGGIYIDNSMNTTFGGNVTIMRNTIWVQNSMVAGDQVIQGGNMTPLDPFSGPSSKFPWSMNECSILTHGQRLSVNLCFLCAFNFWPRSLQPRGVVGSFCSCFVRRKKLRCQL